MEKLREKASNYATENVMEIFKEAFAKVYADGYRDGYKDRMEENPVDIRDDKTEYVDLGLPSGTLWATDYEREGDDYLYVSYDKARKYNIPTKDQCEELINCCKWEHISVGSFSHWDCIGPSGKIVSFFPQGYKLSSDNKYEYYRVLIWVNDSNDGKEINGMRIDTSRYIPVLESLFTGNRLPIRLVKTK